MLLSRLGTPSQTAKSLLIAGEDHSAAASGDQFLASKLRFTVDSFGQEICMLDVDGDEVGVMMGWERELMEETVKVLTKEHPQTGPLKVLNVGFGLGIVGSVSHVLGVMDCSHHYSDRHLLPIPCTAARTTLYH